MTIEVFVENESAPVQKVQVKGVCRHLCDAYETFKTERILDEDGKRVLKEARKKAKDLRAEIIVHDLAAIKGRFAARLRGVKSPSWKLLNKHLYGMLISSKINKHKILSGSFLTSCARLQNEVCMLSSQRSEAANVICICM